MRQTATDGQIEQAVRSGGTTESIMRALRCSRRRVIAARDRLGPEAPEVANGRPRGGLTPAQTAAVRALLAQGLSVEAAARDVPGATLHYVRAVRLAMEAEGELVAVAAAARARRARIADRLRAGAAPAAVAAAERVDLRRVHDIRRELEQAGHLDGRSTPIPSETREEIRRYLLAGASISVVADASGASTYHVRLVRAGMVAEGQIPAGRAPRNVRRHRPRAASSKRRCRVCGKDPAPNYFFCPACHHDVSVTDDGAAASELDGAHCTPGWRASYELRRFGG